MNLIDSKNCSYYDQDKAQKETSIRWEMRAILVSYIAYFLRYHPVIFVVVKSRGPDPVSSQVVEVEGLDPRFLPPMFHAIHSHLARSGDISVGGFLVTSCIHSEIASNS